MDDNVRPRPVSPIMPHVALDGLDLYHERAGVRGGPAVLLLAGMASDSASWQPVIGPLAERFDVVAPDNRCTGRTRPMPVATSRDAMVGDLVGLLDALGLERVSVVGHSMGAMLGWALAAAAPARVERLVATAAPPETIPARVELFTTLARLRRTADESDWFRLLFQFLFSPSFFEDPALLRAAVLGATGYDHVQGADAFAIQADALAGFLDPPDLARVTCPVLALAGERDALTPPAALAARHAGDPDVRVDVLPGAAHALHWENPAGWLERVTAFLDQPGRPA